MIPLNFRRLAEQRFAGPFHLWPTFSALVLFLFLPLSAFGQFTIYVGTGQGNAYAITPNGAVSQIAGFGLGNYLNVATDTNGNVYLSNETTSVISKLNPAGVLSTFYQGNYQTPTAAGPIACDAAGNVYGVGSTGGDLSDIISKITPAGIVTSFASGFGDITGMNFDANGNLFVADYSRGVYKITPAGVVSTVATTATNFIFNLEGIAIDGNGNIYTANSEGYIYKITPAGVVTALPGTLIDPQGLVFDGSDNLIVANGNGPVAAVTPTGVVTPLASGLGDVISIAIASTPSAPTTSNYTVGVSASPSAGGTVIGGGSFAAGSPSLGSVLATANSGYEFANWTENGTVVSTSARYYFPLNSNVNLVANFNVFTNYQTFDVPGASSTFLTGIDGANIVGYYYDGTGEHGFLYNGTTYTILDDPNGTYGTYPQGISGGTIVGYYTNGSTYGFTYNGGTFITPAGASGAAYGISGNTIVGNFNVVGYVYDGYTYIAGQGISGSNIVGIGGNLYNGSTYLLLNDPEADGIGTTAHAVYSSMVVGKYVKNNLGTNGEPTYDSFLYHDGAYATIEDPNSTGVSCSTYAQGISGNTIVGYYIDSNGNTHGFTVNLSSDAFNGTSAGSNLNYSPWFGYYTTGTYPIIYEYYLGFECVFPTGSGVYLYDYTSGHFWYTQSNYFPFVYDFSLNAFLYYYQANTPHRHFYDYGTNAVISE